MKTRHDLTLGGLLLGVALVGQPYDWTNLVAAAISLLLLISGWFGKISA